MKRTSKLNFYKKVRASLLATTKKTDASVITECNIAMPLANDKGTSLTKTNNVRRNNLVLRKTKRSRNNKYNMTSK